MSEKITNHFDPRDKVDLPHFLSVFGPAGTGSAYVKLALPKCAHCGHDGKGNSMGSAVHPQGPWWIGDEHRFFWLECCACWGLTHLIPPDHFGVLDERFPLTKEPKE